MNKLARAKTIVLARCPGRPREVPTRAKLAMVKAVLPATVEEGFENLLLFDCRQIDASTARELVRLVPELLRMRRAWRAHFAEYGCLTCHRKKTEYGAGGLCSQCGCRIGGRMRRQLRQINAGRDIPAELATFKKALTLKHSTAQRLLNGGDE
jgi:hypothetical protein